MGIRLGAGLVWLAMITGHLYAQISLATLSGTIKDPTGAVVPNAAVELRNLATNQVRSVKTGAGGEYVITDLAAEHYEFKVTFAGFKSYVVRDVELQVGQHASIDATLETGSLDQQLTVEATTPLLNAASSSVGQVVDSSIIDNIPLDGRSFWELTALTPGAAPQPVTQGTVGNGKDIRASFVSVTINGTSNIWTGWVLDGANITEPQLGGTLIQPNVDAIQEFRVEGANMPAEYGHTPTLINASLKSGSNGFHGDLFEYVRNSAIDARNYFYNPPPDTKLTNEPLQRNQYGFTIGGPIRRDKTFFFADLEKTSIRQGQDNNSVVPSAAMRAGNFGGTKIVDPLTRVQFPNNVIPASRISPQAAFLLPDIPLANFLQGGTSRSVLITKLAIDTTKADMRLDHQLSAKNQLSGHYSISNNSEGDPNPFPALGLAGLNSRAQSAVLSDTHIFSPRWINVAKVSYYRSIFLFGAILQGTNIDQQAGIQGFADTTPIQSFPSISVSGYTGFTGSPSDQRPKSNRIRDWVYGDTVSFSNGRHDIKLGAELMHQTLGFFNGSSSVGNFTFNGQLSGNAFADFLLGFPYQVTRDYYKNLYGSVGNFWSVFGQDNIRITQNLTLNLGLRWERNPFYDGIRGQKAGYDVATGKVVIPADFDPTSQALSRQLLAAFGDRIETTSSLGLPQSIQPASGGVAPRVGFAWRPFGSSKWAIRSAYGIFYVFPDDNLINNTEGSVPFIASQTVITDLPPAVPTRTFGDFFLGQPVFAPNPTPGQTCPFGFAAASCSTPNLYGGELHSKDTYVQQWNFSVQRQFNSHLSLDLAYVGNKSTHNNQLLSINDPLPGAGAIQTRRPYPQWGTISYPTFGENSNFNSVQSKLQIRTWHDLTVLASYAHGKCIDYGSGEGGTTIALLHAYRAVCDYDQPNIFSGSFHYMLPFGKGKAFLSDAGKLTQLAVRGWQFAGIVTLRNGLPFTPVLGTDVANTGVSNQRPNVIGTPVMVGTVACWFYVAANTSCVQADPGTQSAFASPAQYTYGNAGRNILRADSLQQVNFSVERTFYLSERYRTQFRGEIFNALNHPSFAAPGTNVTASSGGQISSTVNAARVVQLALKFYF
ncbi:MAG TPA: TonB-dependent receptor [Bryobacteraceae bacterium]